MDLTFYSRLECCILGSAQAVLEGVGLPVPSRVEGVYSGVKGDPDCCDSLIVSLESSSSVLRTEDPRSGCHPNKRAITWEVRITRQVCDQQPDCDQQVEDCTGVLLCPGEPWPDNTPDPCRPAGRAATRALVYADRQALERALASTVKTCLCDPASYPDACNIECPYTCDSVQWIGTRRLTGGGCAGSIITLRVDVTG